jgi:tetratricopeptide (TPR) repeat protein
MTALSLISAFVALNGGFQQNKPGIDVYRVESGNRFVLKQDDSLTGEVTFRVIMQTTSPVQAVEFYVGDDLRESDGSTPYEFKLDTLSEEDGKVKLRFKGFTTEGQNAEKVISVNIDNGVGMGAAAHVEKGQGLMSERKYDAAITEGRIALKADKDNIPAKILLAQANFGLGIYDKAQKFAEDVLEVEKKNRPAREVLISIKTNQGFSTNSRGAGDRKDTIAQIKKAFMTAAEIRGQILQEDLESKSGAKDSLEYLDAAIRAKRYSLVIDALEKKIASDYSNNDLNNRLLYSYVRLNRLTEADLFLKKLKKFGAPDGYAFALSAIVYAEAGNDTQSDNEIKEALLNSPDSLGVKTAQAYIAVKRNRPSVLAAAAGSLLREGENRSEAFYFIATLQNRLGKINEGRKAFEAAVRADATDHDMFVEQGIEALSLAKMAGVEAKDREFQYEYARAMFDVALQIRDNSSQALSGIALVLMYQKRYDDALKFADAATRANANYAAAWYTHAATLSYKRQDARASLAKAQKIDPRNLQGRTLPDIEVAFSYFNTTGRTPVVSSPARG